MNGMSNCTAEANRKYSAVYIMANSIGKNKDDNVLKGELHSTAAYWGLCLMTLRMIVCSSCGPHRYTVSDVKYNGIQNKYT